MNYIFIFLLFFTHILFSQNNDDWKKLSEKKFINLIQTKDKSKLDKIRIQLWTVSPGPTITTTFGHSSLRIFNGETKDDDDFYLDFGIYDSSPSFFWKFLKGEAIFFVNIVPTISAYENWDSSGRGLLSTEIELTYEQKISLFKEIENVYFANLNGYFYENFTNNCVTFIREIINNGLKIKLKLTQIDENKNTWRSRVLPYSSKIFWLNIEETLLFDHDTDKIRNSSDLIFLPNDLYRSIKESNLVTEDKILIKDRWGNQTGKSGTIWKIIFYTILIFSLPIALIIPFEKIANILFGLISGFGGIFASAVFFVTSFKFMDETISWLIVSPIDFIFLKKFENWNLKKLFVILISIRVIMFIVAITLKFTIYKQEIGNLLFLSSVFYLFFIIKNKKNLLEVIKN